MSNLPQPVRSDPSMSLIFAIGDIHGQYISLQNMLKELTRWPIAKNDTVVFLGNYVDYGPNSSEVVNELFMYRQNAEHKVVLLRGQHDHSFAKGKLGYYQTGAAKATIDSYRNVVTGQYQSWRSQDLDMDLMRRDRNFLGSLPAHYQTNGLFFCSAGVIPNLPLNKQPNGALMYMRATKSFLSTAQDFGKRVVHGAHPLTEGKPFVGRNRVNVDLNCKATGVLGAVVFNEQSSSVMGIIQTPPIIKQKESA